MAKRNTGRRGRPRKRSSSSQNAPEQQAATISSPAPDPQPQLTRDTRGATGHRRSRGGAAERNAPRNPGRLAELKAMGERPQAPWHPLPLSELLILVGAIAVAVGFARGPDANRSTIIAGVLAVVIGTVEVSLREHLGGFRSHTLMLSLLPPIAFHTAVVLIVVAFAKIPRLLNLGLLFVDAAIAWFLYRLLRDRFRDARRERTFSG